MGCSERYSDTFLKIKCIVIFVAGYCLHLKKATKRSGRNTTPSHLKLTFTDTNSVEYSLCLQLGGIHIAGTFLYAHFRS